MLKADIRHYFETVDHGILLNIIRRKINDRRVLRLIGIILANHKTSTTGKGMPLGNLTSQFFANLYLNELDQFVKHVLNAKYYIRYVDDFVILHSSKAILEEYKAEIDNFLKEKLSLELHPEKSRILKLENGIGFLGFRLFYHHRLIQSKNVHKLEQRLSRFSALYRKGKVSREEVIAFFEGWLAYLKHANTYKYRVRLMRQFNKRFPCPEIPNTNRQETDQLEFSTQKTCHLLKNGLTISQISLKRNIKEATIWAHISKLIEHRQLSPETILPKEKIQKIRLRIRHTSDGLREIKDRLGDEAITFDEISCVLSYVKNLNKFTRCR